MPPLPERKNATLLRWLMVLLLAALSGVGVVAWRAWHRDHRAVRGQRAVASDVGHASDS